MPRFLERDEAEREPPCDAVSRGTACATSGRSRLRDDRSSKACTEHGVHISRSCATGVPYRSLDVATVRTTARGEPFVEISQANPGLIRRDLLRAGRRRARRWRRCPSRELVAMSKRAAELFLTATLPLDRRRRSRRRREDYVEQLSATTGLPHVARAPQHGEDPRRAGAGGRGARPASRAASTSSCSTRASARPTGHAVSFFPRGRRAGRRAAEQLAGRALAVGAGHRAEDAAGPEAGQRRAVDAVPHDPGVHAAPACPPEAFGYYPADHAGGGEILRRCGRGMVFGDVGSTDALAQGDPRVEVHGPGYSKVVLGPDARRRLGAATST